MKDKQPPRRTVYGTVILRTTGETLVFLVPPGEVRFQSFPADITQDEIATAASSPIGWKRYNT